LQESRDKGESDEEIYLVDEVNLNEQALKARAQLLILDNMSWDVSDEALSKDIKDIEALLKIK